MTWNTALTEGSNVDDVLNYIKDFLKEDNTIAVLQQIPYKDPKKRWAESASLICTQNSGHIDYR